jgi:hypothetical protein
LVEKLHSTVDGHVMDHGRTHRDSEGEYDAFDLVGAGRGSRVQISTVDPVNPDRAMGTYYLTKTEVATAAAAREGWELTHQKRKLGLRRKVGKGAITLLSRKKASGLVRTHGAVLKRGFELGMQHPKEPSNVIVNMGAIASMSYVQDRRTIRERLRGLYERVASRS